MIDSYEMIQKGSIALGDATFNQSEKVQSKTKQNIAEDCPSCFKGLWPIEATPEEALGRLNKHGRRVATHEVELDIVGRELRNMFSGTRRVANSRIIIRY